MTCASFTGLGVPRFLADAEAADARIALFRAIRGGTGYPVAERKR
jgi:hypothetical protein